MNPNGKENSSMLSKMMPIEPGNRLQSIQTKDNSVNVNANNDEQSKKRKALGVAKSGDIGLRVPGSNWEKFKTVVTEADQQAKSTSQGSSVASPKKSKRRTHRKNWSNPKSLIKTLVIYPLLFFEYFLFFFYLNVNKLITFSFFV